MNYKLEANVHASSNKVSEVELENLILKQIVHDSRSQENLQSLGDPFHAEILDLKNK